MFQSTHQCCRIVVLLLLGWGCNEEVNAFLSSPWITTTQSTSLGISSCPRTHQNLVPIVNSDLMTTTVSVSSTTTTELSPVLQQMVDERRLYELNLGKAMDTLRKDYSRILVQSPDFSIFSSDIVLVDPSGVQLTGLSNYKNAFSFLQTIVRFFYNTSLSASYVQHRMMYDFARHSIRISWNAVLTPKVVGDAARLYIDGISIYKLDPKTGEILEHRIEKMVIDGSSVVPPYGVLSALRDVLMSGGLSRRSPVGVGAWGIMFGLYDELSIASRLPTI